MLQDGAISTLKRLRACVMVLMCSIPVAVGQKGFLCKSASSISMATLMQFHAQRCIFRRRDAGAHCEPLHQCERTLNSHTHNSPLLCRSTEEQHEDTVLESAVTEGHQAEHRYTR